MIFKKRPHFAPAIKGTWCEVFIEHETFREGEHEGFVRRRSAWATCPAGHTASLGAHEIADDGTVSPSVVCPEVGCGFHEQIQLEGWAA